MKDIPGRAQQEIMDNACSVLVELCERSVLYNWGNGWYRIENGRFHVLVEEYGLYLSYSSDSLEQGRSNKCYKSSSELKQTEFPFTQAAEQIEGWEQKLEITGGVAVEILSAWTGKVRNVEERLSGDGNKWEENSVGVREAAIMVTIAAVYWIPTTCQLLL